MSNTFSWRDLSTVSAAFATTAFAGSVLYDLGYFSALGLSYALLPTTLSDQTRSALIWTPLVAGVMVAAFLLSEVVLPVRRRPLDLNVEADRRVWRIEVNSMKLVGGVLFLYWLFEGETEIVIGALGISIIWGEVAFSRFRRGDAQLWPPFIKACILLVVPTIVFLFSLGWANAHSAFRVSQTSTEIELTPEKVSTARVLRTFELGFIYRVENRVQFQRWDQTYPLQTPVARRQWPGVFCPWLYCSAPRELSLKQTQSEQH